MFYSVYFDREFQPTSPGKTIVIDFKQDYNNGTAKKQKLG